MAERLQREGISEIVVATDGSAHAEAAVEYGAWLAARTGARLSAAHVIDARRLAGHFVRHFSEVLRDTRSPGLRARVREDYHAWGQEALERAAVLCERYDVGCRKELETGNVVKLLSERAGRSDLLVLGQHGEDEERETGFLGSVAEKVVRSVRKPVLLVQPPFREFRRALLAYDGSPAVRRAMRALAPLAAALDMEADAVELVEENEPTAAVIEVPKYFKDFPVHTSPHYLVGDSFRVILDHVEETKSDLLVMGAYAYCTAESISLGSTTEFLMRNSPVPVLVHH